MRQFFFTIIVSIIALVITHSAAFAHSATGIGGGFFSGLTHPIFGWDHLAAMVAVGLWAAILGHPATYILTIAFPLVMAIGAALGMAGISIPLIEFGIAFSAVVLGLNILFMTKTSTLIAAGLVGFLAIFHGHAHGTEFPTAANPLAYGVGFVIATVGLHLAGLGFGSLVKHDVGKWAVRAGGSLIALVGAAFLTGFA